MNQHGGARIREKLEAFCIRHILFKQRVPRKAWRTDLPGVLSIDALLLALWRGNSAWALYYLQDQSKRGLRYTHYFYGEIDFYETTVPAEWLDELIGELRTIVIPVWSKSDWMTTSMSLQGSGFCYRYGVTDGYTIKVLVTENQLLRIRLSWIAAPERSQAFGQRSKQNLSNLVFGRDVELPTHGLDRYGRILAVIFVDGVDANLEQLRSGMAWVFERYVSQAPADIQTSYRQAEAEAREQRRGLWSNPEQIPPWEWRKSEKERSKIGAGRVLME